MRFVRGSFAVLGGALLVAWPYFPATSYVLSGGSGENWSQSYYDNDTGGSLLTMAIGMAVVLVALVGGVRALRWTSALSALFAAFCVLGEWTPTQLMQAIARGFAPGTLDSGTRLGSGLLLFPAWGWGLLLAAVVLLGVATAIREAPSTETRRLHAAHA